MTPSQNASKKREETGVDKSILNNPVKLNQEIEKLEGGQELNDDQKATLEILRKKRKNLSQGIDSDLSERLHRENFAKVNGREIRIGGKGGVPLPPKRLEGQDFFPPEPLKPIPGEEIPPLEEIPSPPSEEEGYKQILIPSPPPLN